jgi:hypothetical protein
MVARSRSGARSGIRGAHRRNAAANPAPTAETPLSASTEVTSFSSSGPGASSPIAILRPSTAPAARTSASPAASCGSINRESAARAKRSLVRFGASEAGCRSCSVMACPFMRPQPPAPSRGPARCRRCSVGSPRGYPAPQRRPHTDGGLYPKAGAAGTDPDGQELHHTSYRLIMSVPFGRVMTWKPWGN